MQPIAVITAPVAGLVYINGRFAGELGSDKPLMLPVNPQGTLYLEFRPFARRWRCSAHRFSFAGGEPVSADDCYVIVWPGSICEISIAPLNAIVAESDHGTIDGAPVSVIRGDSVLLRVGAGSVSLPDGSTMPRRHFTAGGLELYQGKTDEGEYLAAFAQGSHAPVDVITADTVTREASGTLRALTSLNDTVGHSRLDTYMPEAGKLQTVSSEYLWTDGAPKWPATAEDTMLASLEARLLGLNGESEAYMAPELRGKGLLEERIQGCEAALPLRYAPPGGQPGAALIRRTSTRIARAEAVHFHARPDGGPQGMWLIDRIIPQK